jgi:hypothetical protein
LIKNRKKTITILLFLACIVSGIIFASTPPFTPHIVHTHAELDSLILDSFSDHQISDDLVRTYSVDIDTAMIRKIYRVRVSPSFSKTSFHLDLHKKFYDYGFDTPAKVVFPERDMNIYFTYKGTVIRTIRLITDNVEPDLNPTTEQ